MATMPASSCIEQIGETAGLVWHFLNDEGPTALTKLSKQIDAPRDVVMQAVGWLAREDKIVVEEVGRKRVVALLERFQ